MDFDKDRDYQVSDLSCGLFWDVDAGKLDWSKDSKLIVERVLQFGRLRDWKIITGKYGLQDIAKIAMQIRSLDSVSLSFISFVSGHPLEEFRCYTEKQLNPTPWNS